MFNWVCPRCGKDVPPSRTECPYCPAPGAEPVAAAEAPPLPVQPAPTPIALAAAPPPEHMPQAPPQYAPPQYAPPQYAHPQHAHPPAPHYPQAPWPQTGVRPGLPTWLLGLLFALGFLAIFGGAYYLFQRTRSGADKGLENPAVAARQKLSNPLQKYVEVVGIRIVTEKKTQVAKFIVVNHADAEMTDLAVEVTLWASTSRSEEDSVGSFSFKLDSILPNGSKELSAPLKTKLRAFELPDWQNTTAEVQLTSP